MKHIWITGCGAVHYRKPEQESVEFVELTKPSENVTCGDVSNVGDSLIDRIDEMLSVQPDADGCFKNLHDIQMLISRDEAAEIKRALTAQPEAANVALDSGYDDGYQDGRS